MTLKGGMILLLFLQFLRTTVGQNSSADWPCESVVWCKPGSGILHTVQTNKIFQDSKTFVDMPLKVDEETAVAEFNKLGTNPTKAAVDAYVKKCFSPEGTELVSVNLTDWRPDPAFLEKIQDPGFRSMAETIHQRWQHLARKTGGSGKFASTIIPLPFPFIVPGGRFREVYYWDSYWTIKGLLLSELYTTVEGMLDNFVELINKYKHIPNGNRLYYVKRSQPPLFSRMVYEYVQDVKKRDPSRTRTVIAKYIWAMVDELNYWRERLVTVQVNGVNYQLARYRVDVGAPRPESYLEDYELAQKLPQEKRKEWYSHMASGAESGWDYSSRWFSNDSSAATSALLTVETGNIIPVDLNSYLAGSAGIISELLTIVENHEAALNFTLFEDILKAGIRNVLWSEKDSMWFDYNIRTKKHNSRFYPSNMAPFFTDSHHPGISIRRILAYLDSTDALKYPGGVPSSLNNATHQQWDFPNVWPPLVDMMVESVRKLGTEASQDVAKMAANTFLSNVYQSYQDTSGKMFEKYDCTAIGKQGGGGEYDVQEGFGWTNGVTLALLDQYPDLTPVSAGHRIVTGICLILGLAICKIF